MHWHFYDKRSKSFSTTQQRTNCMTTTPPSNTMLQWTHRLRDTLERSHFWASNDDRAVLSEMREVELSGPVIRRIDSTLFPRDFGWDAFVQSIHPGYWDKLILYRNVADLDHITHGPAIDPTAGVER
jgi:hypothetical protein